MSLLALLAWVFYVGGNLGGKKQKKKVHNEKKVFAEERRRKQETRGRESERVRL